MIEPPAVRPRLQVESAGGHWLRRWTLRLVCLFALTATVVGAYFWWTRPLPTPPTEIFRGVTYSCEELNGVECRGLAHFVKVDLKAPGIQLYLTPVDPQAVAGGYQYTLATAPAILKREQLAVVINGALFSADSGVFYQSGDRARSIQTIVADTKVSHVDPDSYLLWFESDLTPHLEFTKPPNETALRRARWGIGGGAIPLWKGKVRESAAGHDMDRRTAVAIDADRHLLWLAVFENASSSAVARVLAEHGAQDGILLDGGRSTTMLLGPKAAHMRPGTLLGGSRPVATFFGIKADSL